ncbi:MAG: MmgE/PrpD family protein [Deltaproteobacteria bacterium]|nr:MmgE/PrpD family protein [Deltaproteobacteria bacterium]
MARNFGQKLANFVVETGFQNLPEAVWQEVKHLLLDSIGCALAGGTCDKGRISLALARRSGGVPESSIIGVPDKISSNHAALANGELINALDYDPIVVGHAPGFVIPPVLVLAESVGASGGELLTSTALGFEIAYRITRALIPRKIDVDPETAAEMGLDRVALNRYGMDIWRVLASGQSKFIFGGTAGAGKILKFGEKEMLHALGIAGHFCPVPTTRKWDSTNSPIAMTKYGSAGFTSMAAVTSVQLAQMGYLGDTTVFDGEYGFWRMYSCDKWDPDNALEKIGEDWLILGCSYKKYPCVQAMQGALHAFIRVIEKNKLVPEEIQGVKAFVQPALTHLVLGEELASHIDLQFNVPYCFACAAYGIPIGADWQTQDTMHNPRILEFMKKVSKEAVPDYDGKVGKEWKGHSDSGAVEVVAKGKIFKEETDYAFASRRPTEEELVTKFKQNAQRVLSRKKVDEAVKCLLDLESLKNVKELMVRVTL